MNHRLNTKQDIEKLQKLFKYESDAYFEVIETGDILTLDKMISGVSVKRITKIDAKLKMYHRGQ